MSDGYAGALGVELPPWALTGPVPDRGLAYIGWLPASSSLLAAARRRAESVLAGWAVPESAVSVAILLLSELVANALKFGAPPDLYEQFEIGMALWLHAGSVVIEISDYSPDPPRLRIVASSSEEGRGLLIVDALSESWGHYSPGPGRKTVYCVLALSGSKEGGERGMSGPGQEDQVPRLREFCERHKDVSVSYDLGAGMWKASWTDESGDRELAAAELKDLIDMLEKELSLCGSRT